MKLTIMFVLLSIVLFGISRICKNDDDEYEWTDAEATIISENVGAVNIEYYAETSINGELQRGVSVPYKKSGILYSNGDIIQIKYHPLEKGIFNKFEFKIMDSRLSETAATVEPWSKILLILSVISAFLAVIMFVRR